MSDARTRSTAARRSTAIVTRPKADATPLIGLLRERGHEVVAFPVLGIEPVADPRKLAAAMARIADYRLVVFVSPNAIRHAIAHVSAPWPREVTIAVMGPGSVAALNALGIAAPDVRIASPADASEAVRDHTPSLRRYDSEALLAALDAKLGLHAGFEGRVLIVRGNGGRAWFADRLRERDIAVDEVESYRRVRPEPDAEATAALVRLFRDDAHADFIVTSSEGIGNLVAMIDAVLGSIVGPTVGADARAWLFRQRIVAPHARIAEEAHRAGFSKVLLAEPGDRGIVAAIE